MDGLGIENPTAYWSKPNGILVQETMNLNCLHDLYRDPLQVHTAQ